MADAHSEDWVEVAAVGEDEEAEIIAGLLESEGIPCEIEGTTATPWPENLGTMGTTRVMVPPSRADDARTLIKERKKDAVRNLAENEDA